MISQPLLIEYLWDNYYGLHKSVHSLSRLMPFYIHGLQGLLQPWERERFYLHYIPGIVNKAETKHFKTTSQLSHQITKRKQDAVQYHHDRILFFASEFIQCYPYVVYDESIGDYDCPYNGETLTKIIVHMYNKLFARLEALLQLRRLSIALPTHNRAGKPHTVVSQSGHWLCTYLITYSVWKRDYPFFDLREFYIRHFNEVPTDAKLQNFMARMDYLEKLMINSGSLNDYRMIGLNTR